MSPRAEYTIHLHADKTGLKHSFPDLLDVGQLRVSSGGMRGPVRVLSEEGEAGGGRIAVVEKKKARLIVSWRGEGAVCMVAGKKKGTMWLYGQGQEQYVWCNFYSIITQNGYR